MEISTLPLKCLTKTCPHYKTCIKTKTQVHKKNKIHIGFIGQGGGSSEGLPFQDASGKELRKCVKELKGELGVSFGYFYSNIVRNDLFENNKKRSPTEDEISTCFLYTESDIDQLQPQVLVLLGSVVTKAFLPDIEESITKISGKTYEIELNGTEYKVVPCVSPSYVLQNGPKAKKLFINSLKNAINATTLPKLKVTTKPQETGKFSEKGQSILLNTFSEVKDYLKWLAYDYDGICVGFDTEGDNLNKKYNNRMTTMQFATDTQKGYVIPWRCKGSPYTPEEFKKLQHIATDLFCKKVKFKYWAIHNQKYDGGAIVRELQSPIYSAPVFDTMVGAYLLDETKLETSSRKGAYKLETICEEMLGFYHYKETGMKEKRSQFHDMDYRDPKLVEYSGMDAYVLVRLFHTQVAEAKNQNYTNGFKKMMFKFFDPVIKLLSFMEWCGIQIDVKQLWYLLDTKSPILGRINEIDQEFRKNPNAIKANKELLASKYKMVPRFPIWLLDLNKPAHTSKLFFDIMKLDPVSFGKEDKNGNAKPSVGKQFQEAYEKIVPEVALFAEYKKMEKLVTSYLNQIYRYLGSEYTDHIDGHIRPNFGLTSTTTGRANCSNVNLQQIPRGGNKAQKEIKNMFVPGPNNMFIMLDYATNEIRWLALLSKDKAFCETFKKAYHYRQLLKKATKPEDVKKYYDLYKKYNDVHKQTASNMYRVAFDKVDPDMRQAAKAINFGLMFGRGPKSLGMQVGIDTNTRQGLKQAKQLIQKWFDACPEADSWLTSRVDLAKKQGYVESPFGRRRRLPGINSQDSWEASHAANQAKNSPVQGTASDASFLSAALMLHDYIIPNKKLWKIPMIVHDSCVLEIPRVESEFNEAVKVMEHYFTIKVQKYITEEMGFEFNCPLDVDIDVSQPTGSELGNYGYGTAEGWDWTIDGLTKLKKSVKFLTMDEWYKKEKLDPEKTKNKTIFQI